ncbi:hypothetical protein EON83_02865 [bacterium]|nr:MAG: hypothetical protein EON83_02865 [bacterium]
MTQEIGIMALIGGRRPHESGLWFEHVLMQFLQPTLTQNQAKRVQEADELMLHPLTGLEIRTDVEPPIGQENRAVLHRL